MTRTERKLSPCGTPLTRLLLAALAVAAAAAAAVGFAFLVGMRTKSPGVQRAVKQMNKNFWNPRAMETAGTPGAYASIVHHVGRRSGTAYETPVVPVKTDGGFAIALPYGSGTDWVQNVLAAGRATITYEGETYEVDRPSVESIDSPDVSFGESDDRAHRIFGVEECLRVHVAPTAPAEMVEAAGSGPG
jgi:deazaflavin-dependent oxidoreductase (nitroreductase family)